jgi:hypothetical protein
MLLGIPPTVDFAFKKIFGSPENSAALIGLLKLPQPISIGKVAARFPTQSKRVNYSNGHFCCFVRKTMTPQRCGDCLRALSLKLQSRQ